MIGAPLFGALADRVGRRKCMALSIGIYSLFTGCAALSQNVTELTAIRAFAGFGLGGVVPVTLAYVGEYAPPKWRGRVIAWWNSMFAFGIPLAGAVGLWVILPYGWRWGFVVGAMPVVLIAFVWWLTSRRGWQRCARRRAVEVAPAWACIISVSGIATAEMCQERP